MVAINQQHLSTFCARTMAVFTLVVVLPSAEGRCDQMIFGGALRRRTVSQVEIEARMRHRRMSRIVRSSLDFSVILSSLGAPPKII